MAPRGYETFAQRGRVSTQIAQIPDSRTYLWIARTMGSGNAGYDVPGKTLAVGLGCDIRHAPRLIYSRRLDLLDSATAAPIGAVQGLRPPSLPQRAFPPIGRTVMVDENRSTVAPYPVS